MQSVCHPPLEHTLSWNPEETEECVRRTSEAQVKFGDRTGGKAHTIDLSGSPAGSPTKGGYTPHFALELENVFEEDDSKSKDTEESPLIDKDNDGTAPKTSRVKFADSVESKDRENGENKPKLEHSDSLDVDVQKGGLLLRQDAMKEDVHPGDNVEIAMTDINTDRLQKQKSL